VGEGHIRRARSEEAGTLSELALRSKGYWGYDAAFLEACRADLTLTLNHLTLCWVLEVEGQIVGFYNLRGQGATVDLDNFFVEPAAIGRGFGRRLWRHAVETARRLGFEHMTVVSDPHAEGFYRAMGMQRIGEQPSTVDPHRMLPWLTFPLAAVDDD
jgi:N-acetylglutamate synthase-like GNAT family acetyltransferase